MVAQTLEDAYNVLDPRQPVRPEEVDRLFVPRPQSPVRKMATQLRVSDKPQKILFVGHRGAGKSSELAYLSTLLDEHFLDILIPLYDIFQSPAVSHTEVIFAMTLRLLHRATDEEVVPQGMVKDVWEKLLEEPYEALRQFLFGAQLPPPMAERSVSVKLSVLAAELETKIGTEAFTRNKVRQAYEGRVAELLQLIGYLAKQLEQKDGKALLVIVEDLDKFDLNDTRRLFLGHARTLTAPRPSVIYTFPVALRYTHEFRTIEQSFDQSYLLPNFALKHRDGSENASGREAMRQILKRRVAPELFANGLLEQAISLSGGHVQTLIQISQQAVLNALTEGTDVVQPDHLEAAWRGLRNNYMVALKQAQIELLRRLRDDPDKDLLDTTDAKQELLFSGTLLEYADERGAWADVNPIVVELLERHWSWPKGPVEEHDEGPGE